MLFHHNRSSLFGRERSDRRHNRSRSFRRHFRRPSLISSVSSLSLIVSSSPSSSPRLIVSSSPSSLLISSLPTPLRSSLRHCCRSASSYTIINAARCVRERRQLHIIDANEIADHIVRAHRTCSRTACESFCVAKWPERWKFRRCAMVQ